MELRSRYINCQQKRHLSKVNERRSRQKMTGGVCGGRRCKFVCMPAPLERNRDLFPFSFFSFDAQSDGYGQRPVTSLRTGMRVRGNLDVRVDLWVVLCTMASTNWKEKLQDDAEIGCGWLLLL